MAVQQISKSQHVSYGD